MSEILKPCPFCGEPADDRYNRLAKCSNKSCLMNHWVDDEDFFIDDDWNTRPIEDALTTRIAELEAENKGYRMLIQDWIDIFDPQFTKRFSFIDGVRLAMIEAIKEREE